MINESGYIHLSRAIIEHEIFSSEKMLKIWIWCLCKASYKDRVFPVSTGRGQVSVAVKRGQFIFGRFKAEEELFIDGSTIYKCIKKLEKLECIALKSNNQYTLVTICNYDSYQSKTLQEEQPSNNQVTTKEQPSNNQVTHTIIVNKVNKVDKVNNKEAEPIFDFKNEFLLLGVENEILKEWLKIRKLKKATNSKISFNAIKKEIEISGITANDCIRKAAEKSWAGFEASWLQNIKQTATQKSVFLRVDNDSDY